MSKFEIWIIILTLIYVLATILIFGITSYQIYQYRKELRGRAILDGITANREILMIGIQHPELLKIFDINNEKNTEEELLSRYAQLWINQAHSIWYRYNLGLLDEAEWSPMRKDLLNMFNYPTIKKRWQATKYAYSERFKNFIDELDAS